MHELGNPKDFVDNIDLAKFVAFIPDAGTEPWFGKVMDINQRDDRALVRWFQCDKKTRKVLPCWNNPNRRKGQPHFTVERIDDAKEYTTYVSLDTVVMINVGTEPDDPTVIREGEMIHARDALHQATRRSHTSSKPPPKRKSQQSSASDSSATRTRRRVDHGPFMRSDDDQFDKFM